MANFSNTIKTTIDVATQGASQGLKSFKSQITEAEGATGKLKAGFGATGDFIKANAAAFAASAGTALIGFAAKSVMAFNDLALEAGKMGEALGIGSEAASRWIEVAGDVGVEASSVEKSMLKMEKAVAATPKAFTDLGIEIARTKSGAVDANETYIRTIEALKKIEDPTRRAEAGTKLLGKGYADLAELINSDVRPALEAVSDAKVIDEEEVAKARALRDALDNLKGAGEDLALQIGEGLTPAITELADTAGSAGPAIGEALSWFGKAVKFGSDAQDRLKSSLDIATTAIEEQRIKLGAYGDRWTALAEYELAKAKTALTDTEMAAEQLTEAYNRLLDSIGERESYLSLLDSLDAVEQAAIEAFEAATTGAADAEAKARDYEQASLAAQGQLLKWLESLGGVPTEVATEIQALINEGSFDEAERRLAEIEKSREVDVLIKARIQASIDRIKGAAVIGDGPGRASGGPTQRGLRYPVVENRQPELYEENGQTYLLPAGDGQVTPMSPMSSGGGFSGGGAGGGVTIVINAGFMVQDVKRSIVEAIADVRRTHGQDFVNRALGL